MKNSAFLLGIILVLIIAVAGIYFYSQTQNKTNETSFPIPGQFQQNTGQVQSVPTISTSCIREGNKISEGGSCCSGLRKIFVAEYSPSKSCEELSENSVRSGTVYYVCSACGNSNCESWENRCNCPQDCKFP